MQVRLRDPATRDGRVIWTLRRDHTYTVIRLDGECYQIVDDRGEPILFDCHCFEIVDPTEPGFWQVKIDEDGERHAGPPGWDTPGFFEDWHDGNRLIRRLFAAQLAYWYPGVVAKE